MREFILRKSAALIRDEDFPLRKAHGETPEFKCKGDPIGAIWGCVGYTVLLCFMLFKTGSISKSIFGAH